MGWCKKPKVSIKTKKEAKFYKNKIIRLFFFWHQEERDIIYFIIDELELITNKI